MQSVQELCNIIVEIAEMFQEIATKKHRELHIYSKPIKLEHISTVHHKISKFTTKLLKAMFISTM